METLPVEMILKISCQLTPEDLAHCCAVTRGWREVFDQDCLWKPHCDREIEKHLRNIPSVVEPVFVTPGGEDSTLTPIGRWRLAFLKEKHLWNNWKHNYHRTERFLESDNEVYREFLTDTLVLRWFLNHFEVWDVSVTPAVFLARTDPSVDIAKWITCSVADESLLVVEQIGSVKVFDVDILNKSIKLKHDISLDDVRGEPDDSSYVQLLDCCALQESYALQCQRRRLNVLNCIKGSFFVHVNASRSNLDIFDLETGMRVKEEPCPVERNGFGRPKIHGVRTSTYSDYVVVVVEMEREVNSPDSDNLHHYIYCPKTLGFLPGPILKKRGRVPDYGELNQHYYAAHDKDNFFTIYDCNSREVLLRNHRSTVMPFVVFDDSFIVKYRSFYQGRFLEMLRKFSPSSKTKTIIRERKSIQHFRVFSNKLLVALDDPVGWYSVLIPGFNVWVKSDISFDQYSDVNRAFTKVISQEPYFRPRTPQASVDPQHTHRDAWHVYHYW